MRRSGRLREILALLVFAVFAVLAVLDYQGAQPARARKDLLFGLLFAILTLRGRRRWRAEGTEPPQ